MAPRYKASMLLAEDQVLKLPAGKYTVREREMMTGSGVPAEFFHATSALGKTVLIGKCNVNIAVASVWPLCCNRALAVCCIVIYAISDVCGCLQHWELLEYTLPSCGAKSRSQMMTASSCR